jgi:hypothetical protein
MSDDGLDLDRLGRDATRYRRRLVVLAPGDDLHVDSDAWRRAIAFLTAGEIELECVRGQRCRFVRGSTLCLGQPVLLIRNIGAEPACLLAISRVGRVADAFR